MGPLIEQSGRAVKEIVELKWFVDGLLERTPGFGGGESARASFLRRDGSMWTTDKDGIGVQDGPERPDSDLLSLKSAEPTTRFL